VREGRECVLSARFGDMPLPGRLSGMVTSDLRRRLAAVRRHDRRQAGRPGHRHADAVG
jgi:hypothetical protein